MDKTKEGPEQKLHEDEYTTITISKKTRDIFKRYSALNNKTLTKHMEDLAEKYDQVLKEIDEMLQEKQDNEE